MLSALGLLDPLWRVFVRPCQPAPRFGHICHGLDMDAQLRNRTRAVATALLLASLGVGCDEYVDDPFAHGFDEGHAPPHGDSGTLEDTGGTSEGATEDVGTGSDDSTDDNGATPGWPTSSGDSPTDTSGDPGSSDVFGTTSDGDTTSDSTTGGSSSGGGGACGGVEVGGHCWYLGGSEATCAATCAAHGGYSAATSTFAGSDGTNANCQLVLNALGTAGGVTDWDDSVGVGCYKWGSSGWRAPTPTTTPEASASGYYRACACSE